MKIIDEVGVPAMLEQLAEECSELAHASLKLARKIRGENPTPKDIPELIENLEEETADVNLCIWLLENEGIIDTDEIIAKKEDKLNRWIDRIKEEKK